MGNCETTLQKKHFWQEPDPAPRIKDPEKVAKKYKMLQPLIFVLLYLLYFCSYLGRKQLSVGFFGTPGSGMHNGIEDLYHLDISIYASLGMIYYFTYLIGKMLGGVIADRANIKYMLPLSVGLSALCPVGIVLSCHMFAANQGAMIALMYISWGLSGFIQAASFPMCGKALTFWYSNKNRATIWSFWSTSHELGSAFSVTLAASMSLINWELVFIVPAIITMSVAIVGMILLRDKPVTIGLPDVEEYTSGVKTVEKEDKEEEKDDRTYFQVFKQEILCSKTIWLLGLAFICVYIMRTGPVDWMIKMFEKDSNGALKTAIIPFCGALGTLSIPVVSKKLFKGRRAPAIFIYFLVGTICFLGLKLTSALDGHKAAIVLPDNILFPVQLVMLALLGIATYGPLVMIGGVASIESASKRVAAATTGFTGGIGYIGAILMSYLGKFSKVYGYGFLYNIWIISGVVAMILMLFLWNQKANKEYSH